MRINKLKLLFFTLSVFYSLLGLAQNKEKRFRLPNTDDEVVVIDEPCTKVTLLVDGEPFDTSNVANIKLEFINFEANLNVKHYRMFNMPPNVVVTKASISIKRDSKIIFTMPLEPNLVVSSLKPQINDIYVVSVEEIVAFNKLGELLLIKNKHIFNIKLH